VQELTWHPIAPATSPPYTYPSVTLSGTTAWGWTPKPPDPTIKVQTISDDARVVSVLVEVIVNGTTYKAVGSATKGPKDSWNAGIGHTLAVARALDHLAAWLDDAAWEAIDAADSLRKSF
jgi:hypothetical protein